MNYPQLIKSYYHQIDVIAFQLQKYATNLVKQFCTLNQVNIFRGGRYNNQERPNILHDKVLATCIAILGAQPNTIRLINEMIRVHVNRDQIRAKNIAAHNIK